MARRQRMLISLGATCVLAAHLWAATPNPEPDPVPPVATKPAFGSPVQCVAAPSTAEFSCQGKLVGLGTEPVLLRIQTLGQCQTRYGHAPVLTLQGEHVNLQTTSGALTFEKLATKPPAATECAATQEVEFAREGMITVEQPKGTMVLQGYGVVFP